MDSGSLQNNMQNKSGAAHAWNIGNNYIIIHFCSKKRLYLGFLFLLVPFFFILQNIAFNDLKRRFWQSQAENQNLTTELKHLRDQLSDIYKQKNHLNKLLACKNEKLAKIEEVHVMMREQEKSQDLHLKELASRIEDLNAEISLYQKERTKAIEENQSCRSTIEQLCKEKKQVRT